MVHTQVQTRTAQGDFFAHATREAAILYATRSGFVIDGDPDVEVRGQSLIAWRPDIEDFEYVLTRSNRKMPSTPDGRHAYYWKQVAR